MKNKKFDCVEMKNEIQAKLRAEYEGLPTEEVRRRMVEKLRTSDDIVARTWRRIAGVEQLNTQPSMARERPS